MVVEGDRGEDIGVVIAVLTMQEFVHRRMSDPRAGADNHTVDCILRLATMQERQQLPDKYHAEKAIVQVRHGLLLFAALSMGVPTGWYPQTTLRHAVCMRSLFTWTVL